MPPLPLMRYLPVLAIALTLFAATVACGSDEEEPLPATEAPAEAPEPTEPPEPSSTQPAAGLEDLDMAAATGQDVVDRVSEAEVVCTSAAFGADYEAFLGAKVVTAYRDATTLGPLFGCLTGDNFVAFGMAYTVARSGLASEAHACLLALGREHPDAVVTILDIEAPEAVAALTAETHNYVVELYNCLTTEERVELTVHMWNEFGTTAVPASEMMAAFTEDEITCFTDTFGITRDQLEAMLASRQPGETSPEATPCITEETYTRIIVALLLFHLGGVTEESAACVAAFSAEHPHFLELARVGTFDPDTMDQSQFEEIAADGLLLFDCLTDDELKAMQTTAARALASFGDP